MFNMWRLLSDAREYDPAALDYLKRAADRKHRDAMLLLSSMYIGENGIERKDRKPWMPIDWRKASSLVV